MKLGQIVSWTAVIILLLMSAAYGQVDGSFPLDTTLTGKLEEVDQTDDWVIVLEEDGILELTITSNDATAHLDLVDDLDLELSAKESKSFPDVPENTRYYKFIPEAGTYHVVVKGYPKEDLLYDLSNTFTAAAFENDPEVNNDAEEAGVFVVNSSVTGHLGYCTEGWIWSRGSLYDTVDWWILETYEDGVLEINATVIGPDLATDVSLYDHQFNHINSGYRGDDPVHLSYPVIAGTYYVIVKRPIGNPYEKGYGSYTLVSELSPATLTNDPEPNDSYEEALALAPDQTITGHLGYCMNGDISDLFVQLVFDTSDRFVIDIPTEGYLTVTATFDKTLGVTLSLVDSLKIGVSSGYPDSLSVTTGYYLSAATYYLSVARQYSGHYGSYTLTTDFEPAAYDNDPEPNNSFENAKLLAVNNTDTGHVGYCTRGRIDFASPHQYDASDYWMITTDTDGWLFIRIDYDETLKAQLTLFDEDQRTVRNSYAPEESMNSLSVPIDAGTYIIKVMRSWLDEYGAYSIETILEPPGVANDPEPNGSTEEAGTILFGSSETGHLGYYVLDGLYDTKDWWRFTLSETRDLHITLVATDDTLETCIEIYDADVKRIKYVYSDGGTADLVYEGAEAGTYYFKVSRRSYTDGYGGYTLSINHTPPEYSPPTNVFITVGDWLLNVTWGLSEDDGIIQGYRIYRSQLPGLIETEHHDSYTSLEELHAAETVLAICVGTVDAGTSSFEDTIPLVDHVTYYYWIQAYGSEGESESIKAENTIVGVASDPPVVFRVESPSPNPFNPSTVIRYELPESCRIRLVVYDLLGRRISLLQDGMKETGGHEVVWHGCTDDGIPVASGIYMFRLSAGSRTSVGKMTLVR